MFNAETLEVTLRGKTIDDVLNMSVEEAVTFFQAEPTLRRKIEVLMTSGRLPHPRRVRNDVVWWRGPAVKIATEMSKLQCAWHTVYILTN
ncbi:MAG: hypothetical protein U0163_09340 [Gemmatimonadaceae bacterium]